MALLDRSLSAVSAAAKHQPGYDGLPVGGKGLPQNRRLWEPKANGAAIRTGDAS